MPRRSTLVLVCSLPAWLPACGDGCLHDGGRDGDRGELLIYLRSHCVAKAPSCRVNLASIFPAEWDRAIIANDVYPEMFGESLGLAGTDELALRVDRRVQPTNLIVLARGEIIVWQEWCETGVDYENRCFFLSERPRDQWLIVAREAAVFDVSRAEDGSFVLSLSSDLPAGEAGG